MKLGLGHVFILAGTAARFSNPRRKSPIGVWGYRWAYPASMDPMERESAHILRSWIVGRVEELRPLEVDEVTVEPAGSAPGWPQTSGPYQAPVDPPPARRYLHDVVVALPRTAEPVAERIVAHLRGAALDDRTMGGHFENARLDASKPRVEAAVVAVPLSASVGVPPKC